VIKDVSKRGGCQIVEGVANAYKRHARRRSVCKFVQGCLCFRRSTTKKFLGKAQPNFPSTFNFAIDSQHSLHKRLRRVEPIENMSGSLYARYVPPKSSTVAAAQSADPPSTFPQSQTQNIAPKKRTKEPKRPKKRKLDESSAAQDEEESEVRRSRQHKTILAKFDKSIKRSEKIRELAGSDDEGDEEEDEEVELHGQLNTSFPLPVTNLVV
jgi:hypothetical protein